MMKQTFSFFIPLLAAIFSNDVTGQSKSFTVSGKVISFEESFPLEGVSIHAKGTTSYTGTQADGTYSIDITPEHNILIFELADYELQEVSLTEKKDYDVILKRSPGHGQILLPGKASYIVKISVHPCSAAVR